MSNDRSFPKSFLGWSLQRAKDGYIRGFKRVNKKMQSIYVGRNFDPDQTERKIVAKMLAILEEREGRCAE